MAKRKPRDPLDRVVSPVAIQRLFRRAERDRKRRLAAAERQNKERLTQWEREKADRRAARGAPPLPDPIEAAKRALAETPDEHPWKADGRIAQQEAKERRARKGERPGGRNPRDVQTS